MGCQLCGFWSVPVPGRRFNAEMPPAKLALRLVYYVYRFRGSLIPVSLIRQCTEISTYSTQLIGISYAVAHGPLFKGS